MDTINNAGLIFGIGVLLFIFLVIVAVSFIIARFSIKYFASKAIIIATPNYQPSVFARLFLKLNFVVYYLFIILFGLYGFLGLCVYGIDKIPPIIFIFQWLFLCVSWGGFYVFNALCKSTLLLQTHRF